SLTKHERKNRMKNCNALENQTTRRILPVACATALAMAFTVSLSQPARRPSHAAARARQYSGAGGEQGIPRGSRRRHPELRLRTLSLRKLGRRLCALHAGGYPVQRRR